jgi:3-hydroxymyristoyl/3-hydroxydecanoyl-(acyl carrier protein) dehydratase
VEAQYDIPDDAWYFTADASGVMPFCVLLEIALQPCGWLAAYAGSALKSENDLKFRNLGGKAVLHDNLGPVGQTLTMRTRMSKVSEAADMIIEHFEFEVLLEGRAVYTGTTYFGYFTYQALSQQVGLRESVYQPTDLELSHEANHLFDETIPVNPEDVPSGTVFKSRGLSMPGKALCMIDGVDIHCPHGGPHKLGYLRGYKMVDPREWFFKAHFYQDPVCPGSLGIESFLQLIKYAALERWPHLKHTHRFEMDGRHEHQWSYRGQVIPTNRKVLVEAVITRAEDGESPLIVADGCLQVDGIYIYKMDGFGLRLVPL